MEERNLKERLLEVAEHLAALPHPGHDQAAGVYASHTPLAGRSPEEILDHIRLHMKYLVFDLEATRRENRYLRQMLERRSSLGDGHEGT